MGNSLEACETTTTKHEWAWLGLGGSSSSTTIEPGEHDDQPKIGEDEQEIGVGGIINLAGIDLLGYKYSFKKVTTQHEVPEEPKLSEDEIPTTLKRLHEMSHAG
jgi:hypothetical protein